MAISEKKRKLLEEFVEVCELCQKKKRLTAHRIRRGWQGGIYEHRNIKMLCDKCHNLIHSNEYSNVQGK